MERGIPGGRGEKQGMGMEMKEMEKEMGRGKYFPIDPALRLRHHSKKLPKSRFIFTCISLYLNIHKSPYLCLHPSQIPPKCKGLIKEERTKNQHPCEDKELRHQDVPG